MNPTYAAVIVSHIDMGDREGLRKFLAMLRQHSQITGGQELLYNNASDDDLRRSMQMDINSDIHALEYIKHMTSTRSNFDEVSKKPVEKVRTKAAPVQVVEEVNKKPVEKVRTKAAPVQVDEEASKKPVEKVRTTKTVVTTRKVVPIPVPAKKTIAKSNLDQIFGDSSESETSSSPIEKTVVEKRSKRTTGKKTHIIDDSEVNRHVDILRNKPINSDSESEDESVVMGESDILASKVFVPTNNKPQRVIGNRVSVRSKATIPRD